MHTHHGMLIAGYADLIDSINSSVDIFLPIGSEISIDGLKYRTFYSLLPSNNPVGFSINPTSWLPGIIGKLFNFSKNTRLQEKISRALGWLTVKLAARKISSYIREASLTTIVFPTACPITFKLGLELEKQKFRVKLVYRLTNTAERRGFYTKFFDLKFNLESLNNSKFIQSKFCYEMKEYGKSLIEFSKELHYSPAPPNSKILVNRSPRKNLHFGFLGMAQKQKGISLLKDIVDGVTTRIGDKKVSWIIQVTNDAPRELIELSKNEEVSLLFGRISEDELNSSLYLVDLICLPYDVGTYKLNASALAYRAADNLTLVATLTGSAFANEISENKIGIVENNIDDLIRAIKSFDFTNLEYLDRIDAYNKMRINSNLKIIS